MTQTRTLPALPQGVTRTEHCRVCGSGVFESVLDLGEQAIGNAFRTPGAEPPRSAPLELVRCTGCSFVQLRHSVAGELMYATYWYRSGINTTMRNHLATLARQAIEVAEFGPADTVIDIGCNDGTSLCCYPDTAHRIGVDPSDIETEGCEVRVRDYFSFAAVEEALDGRRARVVSSIAMFYDLDDPREFVDDVRRCLAPDGVWVVELSYLPAMLAANSYDTICHEHVGYYGIETFERVLDGSGLEAFDVEFNSANGGSFRLFVAHQGARQRSTRYVRARADEAALGLATSAPFEAFRTRVEASRSELRAFLDSARADGATVYGYGASTKGMVTLQYCGVTKDDLVAIAERNPDKYGLLTPGTDIPICSEDEMRAARPDFLMVLPWHFLTEFRVRERDYVDSGGRLVVPMPEFRIVNDDDDAGGGV